MTSELLGGELLKLLSLHFIHYSLDYTILRKNIDLRALRNLEIDGRVEITDASCAAVNSSCPALCSTRYLVQR